MGPALRDPAFFPCWELLRTYRFVSHSAQLNVSRNLHNNGRFVRCLIIDPETFGVAGQADAGTLRTIDDTSVQTVLSM